MPTVASYYFTLFKKFQALGHVPDGTDHGGPGGIFGFDLNDPHSVLSATVTTLTGETGTLLGANRASSPLWAMLNSAATGGPDPVVVGGKHWDAMPPSFAPAPPAWTDFQLAAPAPKLVDVFGDWIDAGPTDDIPGGVIGAEPAPIRPPEAGVSPFVCSFATDDGTRPGGVPSDYWDTSLIFLVEPTSGAIAHPATLTAGSEFYLTAVIGNRGQVAGGRYSTGGVAVEAKGIVMVWNTVFSPGVELPSLSNLDVTDKSSLYAQYFLGSGQYDVVGFRLNVQTVYDGIIKELNTDFASQLAAVGLSADQWVKASPAHLCAKVVVRQGTDSFPNVGDTPINSNRIAQKNLAPFDVNLAVSSPDPNIIWKNFVVGQPYFIRLGQGEGRNTLILREDLARDAFQIYLAMPPSTFERYFREGGGGKLVGYQVVPYQEVCGGQLGELAKPFPHAVILRYLGGENAVEIPALGEREFLGFSLGIEYSVKRMKPGPAGHVTLAHRSLLPRHLPGTLCFELKEETVGGFTIQVGARDPRRPAPRRRP
jgi:hypothetical protein